MNIYFIHVVVAAFHVSPHGVSSFIPALRGNSKQLPPFAATPTTASPLTPKPSLEIKNDENTEPIGKVALVLPQNSGEISSKFGSYSPIGSPSISEAVQHITKKISWFSDATVDSEIIVLPSKSTTTKEIGSQDIEATLLNCDALIAFNIAEENDVQFLEKIFQSRRNSGKTNLCQFALDSKGAKSLPTIVGPHDHSSPSLSATLLPWTSDASGRRMEEQMMGLFDRWTSDDFVVALMIFFNQYSGSEVDWVKYSIDATWEKGPVQNAKEFYEMITKCGDCITKCLADEKCKECLDELTKVDTRDQVASYRTIVSYESELLKDFSFCILQKNNIFGCNAKIPTLPRIEPMKIFKGKELTKQMAKQILVGHLDDPIALQESARSQISWRVAAGANVAYDQFPCQNQIFYEASNGKDMWYDPVFRVETIDGRNVWCKRHYRVREAKEPGTFRFSVLDNGVTSNEFWTIVAAADDLSWIVFHYAGAASSVGQRYLGGLVCTQNGELPPKTVQNEIWPKLKSAGIEPWELFVCDNRFDTPGAIAAGPPPLDR